MKKKLSGIFFICSHYWTLFETIIKFPDFSIFFQILAKYRFFNFHIFCSVDTFGGKYFEVKQCNWPDLFSMSSQVIWLWARCFVRPDNIFEGGIFSHIFYFWRFFRKPDILVQPWVTSEGLHIVQITSGLPTGHIYWKKKFWTDNINTPQKFLRKMLSVHFDIENLSLLFAAPTPICVPKNGKWGKLGWFWLFLHKI